MDRIPPIRNRVVPAASVRKALSELKPIHGRVAIAIPDATRSVDTLEALSALQEWIVGPASVVVGLGLHRPMTDAELAPLRSVIQWPISNHDPDDCVYLGEAQGIPCWIHPEIAKAEHCITLGCVELHQYAGFSGGHKGAAIGCAGRATINALHTRAMTCHPNVEVGRLQGNPFREAVNKLGELIGVSIAIQWVPGQGWLAGEPTQTLHQASLALNPFFSHPQPEDTVLLRIPSSKAMSFYQASRAATYIGLSPAPPLTDGARIVIDAACPEGLGVGSGESAFAEALASVAPPWGDLLNGPLEDRGGVQRALMLARMADRYAITVAGCMRPDALQAVGVNATEDSADRIAGPDALEISDPFVRLPQLDPAWCRSS